MSTGDLQTSGGQAIAFGPFRVCPERRLVLRGDTPVRLGSRAREILFVLVQRPGEIVKKSELIERVWPDTFVEEGTLRVHIAALRKALGDGEEAVRYVENVTGHGYRFVAPFTRLEDAQTGSTGRPNPIPAPLTRVIGREAVVAQLANRLAQGRFVTLVGPGGIGKTTAAIATADHLRAAYPHGIRYVDLASVADPALIPGTVASAFGLAIASGDPLRGVVEHLKSKELLIVLDNCEHVIDAAALVAEALLEARSVHLMATSREPLRARGEWVMRLAPLTTPPPAAALSVEAALGFLAVQLFVERATASMDDFEFREADVPAVAEICRRLDGLPLAIELAAARVGFFGIPGLAARLDDRLRLLTRGPRTAAPRQQTLRATLDWSYQILDPREQAALRRLAVFAGTFDARSAAAVIADEETPAAEVFDILTNLCDKSLVSACASATDVRYRLLETQRVYALERLEDDPESNEVRQRHARLCCGNSGDARRGWEPREWLAGNGQQIDDVRAALGWCFSPDGDPVIGMRLTAASAPLWFESSFLAEYRMHLERALRTLESMGASDPALELELNTLLGSATLYTAGQSSQVTAAFSRSVALARRLGTIDHQRRALWGLWVGRIGASDYVSALGYAEAFRLFASGSDEPDSRLASDRMIAVAHHLCGNQLEARLHSDRGLAQPAPSDGPTESNHFQIGHRVAMRGVLARILWLQGLPDQAIRVARESLEGAEASGHALSLCYVLTCLGSVTLWCGDRHETKRVVARLLEHSGRNSMAYWHFWGRCIEAGLAARELAPTAGRTLLADPLCCPVHQETLASFHEEFATGELIVRAQNGLAGWCTAELLRVNAATLLRGDNPDEGAAEQLLQQSLRVGRQQGALSWELRTATSLARLWHQQGRLRDAHDLLQSVHDRFTEGFGTADLIVARTLLESLSAEKPAG